MYKNLSSVHHWDLLVMLILLGAVFGFEMAGVFCPKLVTITALIKDFIPMPCRWLLIGWIFWHFIASDICIALGAHLPIK